MTNPTGANALYPTLPPAEYRAALADTVDICKRFRKSGLVKTPDMARINRAEALLQGKPLVERPFYWIEGKLSGGGFV
jgi:hypothetical protein